MTANSHLPEIYFIRHGETDWNAIGRYQGQRDIALNEVGKAQAKDNGLLLQRLFDDKGIKAQELNWYVSPLSRAVKTFDIISNAFENENITPIIKPELIEISFGEFEGFLHEELKGNFEKRGERGADFWDFRPKNGENYVDLLNRVKPFIFALSKPCIVVSHGGVGRVFRHVIEDLPKERAVNWAVPQDAILHFNKCKMNIKK